VVILRIFLFLILLASPCFAMLDNGDGTRTFAVGSGGDFTTLASIIYVHPVGVTSGDTISGSGNTFAEDMTIGASGTSGSLINVTRIRAQSFNDGGNTYVRMAYLIATSGTSCITISGTNNEVYNATIVGCTNGVTHSENTTIKNVIFSGTTTDINTTGGSATTDTNITHTTDPLFRSATDYRLLPGSPAINAGVSPCTASGVPMACCTGAGTDDGTCTDGLGKKVPRAGKWDIGWSEYQPPFSNLRLGTRPQF